MADDVLVITGGGSGIGRSVALLAARRGISVAVLARTAAAVGAVAREAEALGSPKATGIVCDVSSEESVKAAFEEAERVLGPLSGVFANVGIELSGFAHEVPIETWDAVIATNLTGTFLTSREPSAASWPQDARVHSSSARLLRASPALLRVRRVVTALRKGAYHLSCAALPSTMQVMASESTPSFQAPRTHP